MSTLAPDLELTLLEETFEPVPCESLLHEKQGYGSHEAQWYALLPCRLIAAFCDVRRAELAKIGDIWCNIGCDGRHMFDTIEWIPIDSAHIH